MNTDQQQYQQQLEAIIEHAPESLRAAVAQEALDHENITSFFSDLLQHGCQSGIVTSLIYYSDTHAFFDKHYDAIEELRYDLEQAFGEPLKPQGDLKNWYAWLGFEETARAMADELHIPY